METFNGFFFCRQLCIVIVKVVLSVGKVLIFLSECQCVLLIWYFVWLLENSEI